MSVFESLGPADRAEVTSAIRDAYLTDEGGIRTRGEAAEEFLSWLASATQAGREYADGFRAEWEREGASDFIHRHWRDMRHVPFKRADGTTEIRPGNRGTRRVADGGRQEWVAMPLDLWDEKALLRGIDEALRRIESEHTTIANYRRLIDLLHRTGRTLVHEALADIGQTLDEFLAADEVAS